MKKMITILSLMTMSSTVFAHVSSSDDRYCGTVVVERTTLPDCITCKPTVSDYYLRVKMQILDETESGQGFVQTKPENLILKLSNVRKAHFNEIDNQINSLQESTRRLLTEGADYCVSGKVTQLKNDGKTALGIDFTQIYEEKK